MTLDRPDDETPENEEHGVLSDPAVDTAGIGVLHTVGTATSQVSVSFAAPEDDDLAEDDVVVDEVDIETLATDDIVLEGVNAGETAPALEQRDAEVHGAEEIHDAQEIHDAEEIHDADEVVEATGPVEAPAAADDVRAVAAAPATAAGRSASGDAVPLTGSVPTTRREAWHADAARVDRASAVERATATTPEVTLAAKRLGEIDDKRESADLLTAERLLDGTRVGGAEPEGLWQQLVYSISRHRINLGDGRRARARKDLDRRIASPLAGTARFVPVLSRKGGVGKTTVTTLLGMALASARDDRVIAIDANPDRGTLADRIARPSNRTVRDLARGRDDISGYSDISTIVARDETRLDVLASDADPRVSEAFSDRDYADVAELAAHFYSIVLTDTGTGVVHSVMGATLARADQLVVVAGLSVDEARLASETLTWLETNGYAAQVRGAVVVLNNSRPGAPLVRESELEAHFRTRVRAVVRMPYDPLIGTGSAISYRDLQPATRQASRELAAAVVEGLRSLASVA